MSPNVTTVFLIIAAFPPVTFSLIAHIGHKVRRRHSVRTSAFSLQPLAFSLVVSDA
jgi:hypothetical protein